MADRSSRVTNKRTLVSAPFNIFNSLPFILCSPIHKRSSLHTRSTQKPKDRVSHTTELHILSSTMLAKATCLVAALVSNSLCFKPPPSSKTVDPKKEQKVVSEVRLLTDYANKFPIVLISISVLETVLYLVLMANNSTSVGSGAASGILKGSSSLPLHDQVIFQEMAVLKTWQKVATVLCLLGYALRKWSFVTLDRFFTVRRPFLSPFVPLHV